MTRPLHADECAIAVMAKAPRPGRCKTRLVPPLTPEQAAILSGAFIRDTTNNIVAAGSTVAITPYVAYAPSGEEDGLLPHAAPETRFVLADGQIDAPDGVTGFGLCLLHAVSAVLSDGYGAACLLNSDSPNLPTAYLSSAARILSERDDCVVLGPAEDGGYYLLGVRRAHARLFADIAWSTGTVADATRKRAAELGLPVFELPPWYDVDDAASLDRLMRDLSTPGPGYAAHQTRLYLETLGLLFEGAA